MVDLIIQNANLIMALGLIIAIGSALIVRFAIGDEEERRHLYHIAGAIGFSVAFLASAELTLANIGRPIRRIFYIIVVLISVYGLAKNVKNFRDEQE